MFRVVYSIIYSLLVLALTGIPTTAQAIKCNDVISQYTQYRYADSLVFFTAHNGKTYAMAKSGATGNTTLPDAYFVFNANITNEHKTTGTDIASLKRFLTLEKYGAARPVSIDGKETLDFVLKRYGRFLGSGTYIDAWKEYGAGGFTSFTGGTLPYTNWTAPVYAGQEPQGVVMDSTGVWSALQNGDKLSQIVEFPEELDCAVKLIPTDAIQPPQEPPVTPPDPNNLNGRICGQDLNHNGFVGEAGETANCIETPQGEFCPVGSTNCVGSSESVLCPAGSTLEPVRDMCQADQISNKCPAGYSLDAAIDRCTKAPPCPDGGFYNGVTDRCEKLVQNECPSAYSYDSARGVCVMPVDCGAGGALNPARDRCERTAGWDCSPGFTYNADKSRCETIPACSTGTYNSTYNKCMLAANVSCPAGYTMNVSANRCEKYPECPAETSYSAVTKRCEGLPSCTVGSYNGVNDNCVSYGSYAATVTYTCPDGGSLNGTICNTYTSYNAILTGGVAFDRPVYNNGGGGMRCQFPGDFADGSPGINCFSSYFVGYASTTPLTSGSVPYYHYYAFAKGYQCIGYPAKLTASPSLGQGVCIPPISPSLYGASTAISGVQVHLLGGYISSIPGRFGGYYA